MNSSFFRSIYALCLFLVSIVLIGCGSARSKEFALSDEDYNDTKAREAVIYMSRTQSIDSTDPKKIFVDVWKTETEDYPKEIRLYVRVMDSTGAFITNMAEPYKKDASKQYFSGIIENLGTDSTVQIQNYSVREYNAVGDSLAYSIVLALDHGGSMGGTIESLQDAAELFTSMKYPFDKISIVKFDKQAVVEVPMTASLSEIQKKFKKNGLEGYGLYTSVFDAATQSLDQFSNTSTELPRVLVLFTDGEDNTSKATDTDLYEKAKKLGVRIFTVGFGYVKEDVLQNLSKFTGGKYYRAYSKNQLKAIFSDIYLSLRNYYKVTYQPPVYDGLHKANVFLTIPEREKLLAAEAEYDKSPLNPFNKIGSRFAAERIYFDYKLATLRQESNKQLDEIAALLRRYKRIKLEIQGHTDNIGGEEYNQRLSEARAQSVMNALVQRGVEEARLRARGFGMSQPIVPNDTEENRSRNRRTEFVIIAR